MMREIYEDVANTMQECGISPPKKPLFDLDYITSDIDFDEISLKDYENIMLGISSYITFLESQKGSFEAQVTILQSEYNRLMGLATLSGQMKKDGSILSKDEKQAYALGHREDLRELNKKLLTVSAKLSKVKNLPFSLNKRLDILRMKYQRRLNDQRG